VAEPASAVREVAPPPGGLWRIGRAGAPLTPFRTEPQLLALPRAGNRFDAPDHGTLYFATTVHACYGETLASHRPRPELAALVAAEWDRLHHLAPAQLPRDWRARRVTVHITGVGGVPARPFLDVEAPETHQVLRLALAPELADLGHHDLGVAAVRGPTADSPGSSPPGPGDSVIPPAAPDTRACATCPGWTADGNAGRYSMTSRCSTRPNTPSWSTTRRW